MNISRHFQGSFFWNAHNIGKLCLICPEVLFWGNPLPDTCSQPCSHHTPTICAGEISSFPLQSRHLYRSDWLIDGTYLYCATVYSFWSCILYKCRPIFCISLLPTGGCDGPNHFWLLIEFLQVTPISWLCTNRLLCCTNFLGFVLALFRVVFCRRCLGGLSTVQSTTNQNYYISFVARKFLQKSITHSYIHVQCTVHTTQFWRSNEISRYQLFYFSKGDATWK